MKNYSLLFFTQTNAQNFKLIFPLHEGENIIGTGQDSDIHIQLNKNMIEPIHAKISVNKQKNLLDIGIKIFKSNIAYIKKGENKKILLPGKEYELSKNSIFYLNETMKFKLIKGTIEEIKTIFDSENLEIEFQKWYKKIIENETKMNLISKNFVSSKNEKENILNKIKEKNNCIIWNDCKIVKNDFFSIKNQKKKDEEKPKYLYNYLKNSSSILSLSSSNKINNYNKLLNLYNISLNKENIEKIFKEKENIIRQLLGENGLDIIVNSTNYKQIKKYDNLYYRTPIIKKNAFLNKI